MVLSWLLSGLSLLLRLQISAAHHTTSSVAVAGDTRTDEVPDEMACGGSYWTRLTRQVEEYQDQCSEEDREAVDNKERQGGG